MRVCVCVCVAQAWLYDACRPHDSVGLNSHGGWNRRIIYNNMFMANVSWWLTEEVRYNWHKHKTAVLVGSLLWDSVQRMRDRRA